MNNFESTGAGSAGAENTEREDFAKVDARLDEIKSMNLGDMSREEVMKTLDEKDALERSKAEMMSGAQESATAEDQERNAAEKAAAEVLAQAEQAKQIEERRQAERAQADALLAEIRGGSIEKKEITDEASAINAMAEAAMIFYRSGDRSKYDATWAEIPMAIKTSPGFSEKVTNATAAAKESVVSAKPEEVQEAVVTETPEEASGEQVAEPQNPLLEKYGEKMRQDVEQLSAAQKLESEKYAELIAAGGAQKRPDLWEEYQSLKNNKNNLIDTLYGAGAGKIRLQKDWESFDDYKRNVGSEYFAAVMSDPASVSSLAEAGLLGDTKYGAGRFNFNKVDQSLREDPEYMKQLLDILPAKNAGGFWEHAEGGAKGDKELYVAAVAKNPLNYQFGPDEWKTDPEIQKVALESGLDPMYLKK